MSMSGWWSKLSDALVLLPSTIVQPLSHPYFSNKATTLFLIKTAHSPSRLLSIISERLDQILADNICLAHVRLLASKFLLVEIFTCLQRLEARATCFRLEASSLLALSRGQIQLRIFQEDAQGRAQLLERDATAIDHLLNEIQQFVGMHVDALDDVHAAIESQHPTDLARAIVFSCRQASSFTGATAQSNDADTLRKLISEAVRSSLGCSPRRDISDQMHVAGQLGQFWNQNGAGSSSKQVLTSHDVGLTLQILQKELENVTSIRRQLRRITERNFGEIWDVRRRPVRYTSMAVTSIAVTKSLMVHSRYLGGSGLIEDKALAIAEVTQAFLLRNVVEPVGSFHKQVFRANPSTANEESVAVARASLRGMLIDFTERNLTHIPGAVEKARNGSLIEVTNLIRDQATRPIKNVLSGNLGQAFLLQIQKLKCDVEDLMVKSKQLLRAQELNLALVALLPALLTAASLMYMTSTALLYWRSRETNVIVSGSQTARFLIGDVYDILSAFETDKGEDDNEMDTVLRHVRRVGKLHLRIFELEELVNLGVVSLPQRVALRFSDDLKLLGMADVPLENRRRQTERMLLCYPFLRGG